MIEILIMQLIRIARIFQKLNSINTNYVCYGA